MKKQLVIFLLIIFAFKISLAQEGSMYFRDITVENGLSSNHVQCIAQDHQGFMWFGADKLNRYDGNEFKVYKHDPNEPESISSNSIISILEDSKATLWVGTSFKGLNRFDKERQKFIVYTNDENDSTSISSDYLVSAIYEDRQGQLWIGTSDGLNRYDAENDHFIRYTHTIVDSSSIRSEGVTCIYEDSRNNFWIGTRGGGLVLFDRETRKSIHFKHKSKNLSSISSNFIQSISEDNSGMLWVGTENGYDRCRFSGHTAIFEHYRKGAVNYISSKVFRLFERKGSSGLMNAIPNTDFIDNRGNIWIGTKYSGVKYYNTLQTAFNTYKYQHGDPDGLKNSSVKALHEKSDGNLWIGVDHGGLHLYNRRKNTFTHVALDPQAPANPFDENIHTIEEDSHGDLWIGTWTTGVYKLEKKSGKSIHYMPEAGNPASLNSPYVLSIFEDSRQNIWLGTWLKGISLYDRENDSFIQFPELSNTIVVVFFYEDSQKNLWICTDPGLYIFDRDSRIFRVWLHDPVDTTSLSSNDVRCIYEDRKGNLWVGTSNGLNLFDRERDTFTSYHEKDGLPDKSIRGILEDDSGNLWLSTHGGLSKFNPVNKTFKNYDVNDGLQGNDFNRNACLKSRTRELVFGGKNGFTIFNPDSIKDIKHISPVVITEFQIFNKTVRPGEKNSPLQKDISLTDKIILKHNQRSISFKFAILDYASPEHNRYKYMLEGFHEDWIEIDANLRMATFTNLEPGEYVFRVIGSNNKGVWNYEGVSIKIIITPPWWQTTLAYIVYIILTGLIVWLIWKAQLRRVHIRQELKMRQFETNKLQELDQMKSRFFANISHEIRTPLTLILGPLEQLISEASKDKWKNQLHIMSRNGRQLLSMINQLLDFSKAESGRMLLKAKEVNIVPKLKGMVYSFDSLAKRKKITLTFKTNENVIPVYSDTDKLEKIMANLLSNAFKFTEPGGTISVNIMCRDEAFIDTSSDISYTSVQNASSLQQYIQISISDTGIGIAPEHLDHIFDRYYQAEDNKKQTGTGIGLALTKELVELHHGHIFVQSKLGEGSTFIVQFLSGKAHLSSDEIVKDETAEISEAETKPEEFESVSKDGDELSIKTIDEEKSKAKKDQPIILIVEDTEDVRNYIKGFLESKYQIKEAQDGNEGYEKAIEIVPDLIVSDVMMPRMDGFQLCEKLKTDERTSHIPVILLTARASEGSKLEGLETGADDYIIKPFNSKELEIRIKNLIEQRQKLRERFTKDISLAPKDISVTSADERFLNRAIEIIEKHMGDPEFGVDIFGKEIGLSHSQLHRKIRALTNLSPVEFIRTLRLKRAVNLLKQKFGNVAEIAYEVGFSNPSYFTECFRKLFGKSPTDYLAKN